MSTSQLDIADLLRIRSLMELTDHQLSVLTTVERAASALSALGVITIITVFCLAPQFRNPMHRLIFINAFYNAFDITCTMIATSGPAAGDSSVLCQFQAFLNQMFPLADVLWTLAMAVDVFLVVFFRYDVGSLKKLERYYAVVITTITFVPALIFLFIRTEAKGSLYGSVTLWCSISPNWILFRIILYYAPIWHVTSHHPIELARSNISGGNRLMILIIVGIYITIGIEMARRRRAFAAFDNDFILLNDGVVTSTTDGESWSAYNEAYVESCPKFVRTTASHFGVRAPVAAYVQSAPMSSHHRSGPHVERLSFRQYILMPLFFSIALLSVWIAPSINRIGSFVNPNFSSYPLLLAVGTTGCLRGFWNGVVFVTIGMKTRGRH